MWYFVRRRGLKPRNEWTVTLDEHLVWMKQQHESGTIIMSGPSPDRKFGMYLIRAKDKGEAERIFNALADGGKVQMPLAKTFFSPSFGMLADRFGVNWMVIAAEWPQART